VGAVDQGGGWLYDLLVKFGVSDETAKTVTDLIVRPASILLVLLVCIIVARYGSKAIRRILERAANQTASRSGSPHAAARVVTMSGLVANIWRFFIFIVGAAIILGMLGVNLTPLLASATIIGATLGFGAQQIVRDYFSGFLMTVENQFNVGDSIFVGGATVVTGVVEDVSMRLTRLRSTDGTIYHVPNGDIRTVGNLSRGWARAVVDLDLPADAAVDFERVNALVGDAATRVAEWPEFQPWCTEPPTLVGTVASDTSSLTVRVMLKTVPSQRDALERALRQEAIGALAVAGVWPGAHPAASSDDDDPTNNGTGLSPGSGGSDGDAGTASGDANPGPLLL
jgi:small conductance mechanosensitive channel